MTLFEFRKNKGEETPPWKITLLDILFNQMPQFLAAMVLLYFCIREVRRILIAGSTIEHILLLILGVPVSIVIVCWIIELGENDDLDKRNSKLVRENLDLDRYNGQLTHEAEELLKENKEMKQKVKEAEERAQEIEEKYNNLYKAVQSLEFNPHNR